MAWHQRKEARETRQQQRAGGPKAMKGERQQEWQCSLCYRTNFLENEACRGTDCWQKRNPKTDWFIDRWGQKTAWPQEVLTQLSEAAWPAKQPPTMEEPPPPSQQQQRSPQRMPGFPVWLPPAPKARPPGHAEPTESAEAGAKQQSTQRKLEQARAELKAAEGQGWDAETREWMRDRVDRLAKEASAEQPAWHRLQQKRKALRTACDRAENAHKSLAGWSAELAEAKDDVLRLQQEHGHLAAEAARSVGGSPAPPETANAVAAVLETLRKLAGAVEACWTTSEAGGVPPQLAEALRTSHEAVAKLGPPVPPEHDLQISSESEADDEQEEERRTKRRRQRSSPPAAQREQDTADATDANQETNPSDRDWCEADGPADFRVNPADTVPATQQREEQPAEARPTEQPSTDPFLAPTPKQPPPTCSPTQAFPPIPPQNAETPKAPEKARSRSPARRTAEASEEDKKEKPQTWDTQAKGQAAAAQDELMKLITQARRECDPVAQVPVPAAMAASSSGASFTFG